MECTVFVLVLFGVQHFLPHLCADDQFSSDCSVTYSASRRTLRGTCSYADKASTDRSTNCQWSRTNPGQVKLTTSRTGTGRRSDGTYYGSCTFTRSNVERWQSGVHTYSIEFYAGKEVIVSAGPTTLVYGADGDVGEACLDGNACTGGDLVCESSTCKKKIGIGCSAGECVANGECDTTCKCSDNFVAKSNTACLKQVDQPCTANDQCLDNGQCGDSGTGTCKCSANYVAKADKMKCLAKIGQTCTAAGDCVESAGECSTGTPKVCACSATNVATDDNSECKKKAGETCTADTECVSNAECPTGSTRTCTCKSGFTKQTSGKCSGAASITASLLVMLAVIVTSRLV